MTDPPDRDPDPSEPDGPQRSEGSMRPMGPAAPAAAAAVGLVGGWLVRPVATALDRTPPLVPWGSVVVLLVVAGVLGLAAVATRRSVSGTADRLEPHHAVNRLLLARACAVVGALVAGAYAGYAVSWLGLGTELAEQRLLRSGVAVLGALATVTAALLLERACRTRSGDPEP